MQTDFKAIVQTRYGDRKRFENIEAAFEEREAWEG